MHLEGELVECGLEKRGQCRQRPPWEQTCLCVCSIVDGSSQKTQTRAFQIVQLGTKRDGRLLSQVEAIKPRVWKARTWTRFSVHTPEANHDVLLGFSLAASLKRVVAAQLRAGGSCFDNGTGHIRNWKSSEPKGNRDSCPLS